MLERRNYDKTFADELAKDFCQIARINLKDGSRYGDAPAFRALLYKVLNELNDMNDRMISEWFKEQKIVRNRSSIFHALKKVGTYYNSSRPFRVVYDIYFNDRREENIKRERIRLEKLKARTKNIKQIVSRVDSDRLNMLIDTVPEERREEVFNVVNLRIKSWSWKSKDQCEIIESSTSMDGMHW